MSQTITITPAQGKKWRENGEKILALKSVRSDMTAYNRFLWPKEGYVEAPDWRNVPECGYGLHGLAWGEGDFSLLNWDTDAVWLVLLVDPAQGYVDLGGKVKFKGCDVLFAGSRGEAVSYLIERGGDVAKCVGGTATAGDEGTATAGNYGTATAGNYGTATAGDEGTATAGYKGTATAGDEGILIFKWWDSKGERWRIETAYVGEDGIEADVAYRCNDGKVVRCD